MLTHSQRAIERIKQAGIVALLPGDLSLNAVTPVADALLAAPVLAAEVYVTGADNGRHAHAVISDLRQRAGVHMLVGAGGVETTGQAMAAVDAGAQFVASPRLEADILLYCREQDVLYLPGVISLFAAQAAETAGCSLVRLTTGGAAGPRYVATLREVVSGVDVVVTGHIAVDEVSAYAQAGALAFMAAETLFTGSDQPMADLIIRARILQRAWGQL
jgi:2-dehydro-3-deoxyphosphogluconate aldolase / (4S)-4-hydroxy-2-oxoglutarate aldolase